MKEDEDIKPLFFLGVIAVFGVLVQPGNPGKRPTPLLATLILAGNSG